MKRDMELIRLLLLEVEGDSVDPKLSEYSEDKQVYHMALLIEAGYVDGGVIKNSDGYPATTCAIRLTWQGHEFLDTARNASVWNKAVDTVKKSGVDVSATVFKELLTSILKTTVGLPG